MRRPQGPNVYGQRGFSLIELLISMAVMLLVLAGTMQMMSTAIETHDSAKQVLDMNAQLRAAMDLVQRDLLQAGQGLPDNHEIGVPNGAGIDPIKRPGPASQGDCPGVTTFRVGTSLPAVTTGPGLGPAINGECTDVITILAADNMYGPVRVTAIAADGRSATMAEDDPNAQDRLRPGDLLMLRKGSNSVLMQITAVSEDGTTVTFGTGTDDPLGLNWFTDPDSIDPDEGPFNTVNQFKAAAPADHDSPADGPDQGTEFDSFSDATRIRMITYYIDTDDPDDPDDAAEPRLVRIIGGGTPNAVGLGAEAFRVTYDLVGDNAATNGVQMNAADLDGSGACDPLPCSERQIRKVNVLLSLAGLGGDAGVGRNPVQNTLRTQVSLRSMAFVDRYR